VNDDRQWTPQFLESMRQVADPVTDPLIDETLAFGGEEGLRELNRYLQSWKAPKPAKLAPGVRAFLDAPVVYPPWVDDARLDVARKWFDEHGLLAILALFMKGLPQYFANANANPVFRLADLFRKDTIWRFAIEIAQLIFDVFRPGGLSVGPVPPPGVKQVKGDAVIALQKLRIHHSFLRYKVIQKAALEGGWNPQWGKPINQEDLALAVVAFALWILDGVRKLGCKIDDPIEAAGLEVWNVMGFLLGVDDRVRAATPADGRELIRLIGERQFRPSQDGTDLVKKLLATAEGFLPSWLSGVPQVLMNYLMDPFFLVLLKVPRPYGLSWIIIHLLGLFMGKVSAFGRTTEMIAGRILHGLQTAKGRDGDRTSFRVPQRQVEKYG